MTQRSIPVVYMRGGTSRALMFHGRDLPPPGPSRDAVFCGAMGSPDPGGRQLDGMGCGITSLSKVAIIGPSSDPRADVDYTFGQVDVQHATVSYRGNCGNISSAVGPFAIDEGLLPAPDGPARVVIHNTNTHKLIEARFHVTDGRADVMGDFPLQGVAGTGAPIELAFLEPGGAATGRLLPTGRVRDMLTIPDVGAVEISIVDAANPTVFVRADRLGLSGVETPAELSANAPLMAAIRNIRAAAAMAAGLIADPLEAFTILRNLPLVCIMSAAADNVAGTPRITVRMFSADLAHNSTPLTGAMCVAVAAHLPDTVVANMIGEVAEGGLVIHHAAGNLFVKVSVSPDRGGSFCREVVVCRTARRLMDGRVYVP